MKFMVESNSVCDTCALRLYNTKSYNLQGVGNPYFNNCIVVPNVDYKAYKAGAMSFSEQVKLIEQSIISSTGGLLETTYIVPLIRCNEAISCKIDDATFNKCLTYFIQDLKIFNFKHILLLGTAAQRLLKMSIEQAKNYVYRSPNNRFYSVNYSPLIKYVNDKLYEDFVDNLNVWYNSAMSNEYNKTIKQI